jgi:hypothetical protein
MNLETIRYKEYEHALPQTGKHILCQQRGDNIIVYQAFNPRIAAYAVTNQQFGGEYYKFSRMSWIKPNFLWMMYRADWASKEHQQQILAIEMSKGYFLGLLSQAVHSSYKESVYGNRESWKDQVAQSSVRLQWDPDHDPYGNKLDRRAIQLGLRGNVLRQFATDQIRSVEDITTFVKRQKALLDQRKMDELTVIKESVLLIEDKHICQKLELDST